MTASVSHTGPAASTRSADRDRRVMGPLVRKALLYACFIALLALFLYPLWWMLANSFRRGNDIASNPTGFNIGALTFENYRNMFADVPIGTGFKNTAIMLFFKGGLTMIFCPLAGFAFAKYEFAGKKVLFSLILLTLTLPVLVLVVPLLLEMSKLNWVNSYQGLILPGSVDAFGVFYMRQVISAVPDELIDAGRLDGAGTLTLLRRVIVPVIRPGLAALGVLTFLAIYNDFLWPLVEMNDASRKTLQVVLGDAAQNVIGARIDSSPASVWGELLAATTVASLPVVVAFMFMQRHFVRGILAGSSK
jgi:multiple sugar transport system permease protein